MAFGALAQILAQGMRGKRLGAQIADDRDRQLVADYREGEDRQAERDWRQGQAERQARLDARQAGLDSRQANEDALRLELLRMQMDQRGPYAPKAERDPIQEYRGKLEVDRELGIGEFKPRVAPPQAPVSWERITQPDGSLVAWNPRTNETRPITGVRAQPPGQGQPTEGERKAAAFYQSGKFGYDALESILKDNPRPGFAAQSAAGLPFGMGNMMTSDTMRQIRQSALMLSDAWLRYTSGSAVPEQEVERFAESFIPKAGDDDTTLQTKAAARKQIVDALRDAASRALPASPAGGGTPSLAAMGRHGPGREGPPAFPENPYR